MKFPFSKKKSDENLSRREIAVRRRTENYDDLPAQSYRRNRTLNSRQTSSPLETSERLETHELVKKRRRVMRKMFATVVSLLVVIFLLFQLTINISIQRRGCLAAIERPVPTIRSVSYTHLTLPTKRIE